MACDKFRAIGIGSIAASMMGLTPLGAEQSADGNELLVEVLNPDGCGQTDRSPLTLRRAAKLSRVDVWYDWDSDEEVLDYVIRDSGGSVVHEGMMFRSDCDPNQGNWCFASDEPLIELPRGAYSVVTAKAKICQNQRSGVRGFIRAWGIPNR